MKKSEHNQSYAITQEEKILVQDLFITKKCIMELMESSTNNNELYELLRDDYIDISTKFSNWFLSFERNYDALGLEGYHWNVDFLNNSVFLEKNN